jgi:hypothetical protein
VLKLVGNLWNNKIVEKDIDEMLEIIKIFGAV